MNEPEGPDAGAAGANPTWRRGWGLVAAALAPILVLTLAPGPSIVAEPISIWCVVCGWRGASDAILNILLFVPFGFALGRAALAPRAVFLVGLLVTLGIEVAQTIIPNRSPGLGDVIYNSGGALLGAMLYRYRSALWSPDDARAARRRTLAWATLGLVVLGGQAWLLAPAFPRTAGELEWTPTTAWGLQYAGRVLAFREAGRTVLPGPVPADLLDRIGRGTRIEVSLIAGPTPDGIAPLVRIRDGRRDVFAIELDHRDIVLTYRTRGMVARLDRPLVRWDRGTSTWIPGDTVTLRIRAVGDGMTLAQSGGTGVARNPDYEPGPVVLEVPTARAWAFLMYPRWASRTPGAPVDFLWMLVLALPLGLWGKPRGALLSGALWIAVLLGLPLLSPLLTSSGAGVLGVVIGVPLGLLIQLVHRHPEPFKWWKPLDTLIEADR